MRKLRNYISTIFLFLILPSLLSAQGYGDCTKEKHATLQNRVEIACKSESIAYRGTDNRTTLNSKISKISACIDARKTINTTCFKGGNEGHKQAVQELVNGIKNCQSYLSKVQ